MPIDPDVLAEHIKHSRFVHHVTLRAALPSIRECGLAPGSELGHRLHDGFHQTREGHVYLSNLLTVGVVEVPGERALLAVDLSQLDPELIDPDEDAVQDSYFHRGRSSADEGHTGALCGVAFGFPEPNCCPAAPKGVGTRVCRFRLL